jgi:Mrp family chromosome partitioning ATPase
MTTLNQAFIKAYQRRGVAAPHMPLPATANEASHAAGASPAPQSSPTIPARSFDRPNEAIPPAHVSVKAPPAEALADRHTQSHRPQDVEFEAVRKLAASEVVLPWGGLSGPSSGSDGVGGPLQNESSDSLLPAYEVEHFEWPPIVTSLLERSDAEVAALLSELLPDGRGSLLVTGCRRGEGRTSVALLIARHLAKAGSMVLLVDADLNRPGVATSLATDVEVGWEETLSGASLSEALIESLGDRLVVLPLRRAVEEAALAGAGAALKKALDRLRSEFAAICIDAGPVEAAAGRHEIWFDHSSVEAAVVVRDVRHCRLEQSHAVGRQLVELGARRWAIIENFV